MENDKRFHMRRKDRQITNSGEIEDIIKKATVCRIGLVDNDEAYIVPVCFGYEKNTLYFHSALIGRKVELIKENNKICFEMEADVQVVRAEKPCRWAMKYRSVFGVGRAEILESDEEKSHGLELIIKQYTSDESSLSFDREKMNSALVIRIDIENMTSKKAGY